MRTITRRSMRRRLRDYWDDRTDRERADIAIGLYTLGLLSVLVLFAMLEATLR